MEVKHGWKNEGIIKEKKNKKENGMEKSQTNIHTHRLTRRLKRKYILEWKKYI